MGAMKADSAASPHKPGISVTETRCVLANALVCRILELDDGAWRTTSFARADGADANHIASDEFLILMMDGRRLTVGDYRVEGAPCTPQEGDTTAVEITYVPAGTPPPGTPPRLTVRYSLGDEPYLRKTVCLEMPPESAIDRLEVERFRTPMVCDLGGLGEPIFMGDNWFSGLEYPGSRTEHSDGVVTLAHYPGRAKSDDQGHWSIQSKTAVVGTGLPGDPVDVAFHDYLESIRQPAVKHLLINTWMSTTRNPESADQLLEFYDKYDRNLRPYGVGVDSLQPDLMGWEPKTLSRPRKDILPNGYKPLSDGLKARGSRLSLWLSLVGVGNISRRFPGHEATAEWAREQGFKRTDSPCQDFDGHYCVSVPEYKAAMCETLKATVEDGDICYFKHDFTQTVCSAEGHEHLPTRRHGFEANTDTLIEFMTLDRQLKSDILCAPTSYVWQSPWWLMHANYIYWGASDSGDVSAWPQPTRAEWGLNYHDGHLFKIYHKWRHTVPLSGFNTQAFLRHSATLDPLREWTDYAVMACGRGLRLMDLYFEPELPPEYWKALGTSLNWWQENLELMGNTRMVGGNPHNGQVHGYAHWQGERGMLCLRNPHVAEQMIRVPFDKSVLYRGPEGTSFRGRVIYPYVETIPVQFVSGNPIMLSVPGHSVMVIELEPGGISTSAPAAPVDLIEGNGSVITEPRDWSASPDFREDPSMSLTARLSINLPDEAMARCDLLLIARSNAELPEFPSLTVNGKEFDAPAVTGSGDTPGSMLFITETDAIHWSLHRIDLLSCAGETVAIVATSNKNDVPFMLDAWLVTDRPVTTGAEGSPAAGRGAQENLPPTTWHNYRRQTVHLLEYCLNMTPIHM